MAVLDRLDPLAREHLESVQMPDMDPTPGVAGPDLARRRVALISTAGIHRRSDPRFLPGAADYRVIPGDVDTDDLVMSHLSVNFDRSGWEQDVNVAFPLQRLRGLADEGVIDSVADVHYAVMGATNPVSMKEAAEEIAGLLHRDRVGAVVLVPV